MPTRTGASPGRMEASSRYVNFRTCCRLCRVEECELSNIFSSNQDGSDLAEKIYSVIGIKVTVKDRITTSVCDKCILYINKYDHFKNVTLINQVKLHEQLSIYDAKLLNETIIIKEEIESDEDVVFVPNELSIECETLITTADDEMPPILSPNLPTGEMLRSLDVGTVATIEEVVEDDIPTIETIETITEDDSGLESFRVPELQSPIRRLKASSAASASTPTHNDSRDKIDFAAGLQLAKKMDSINMEPFTRTEIQYERRMQLIYSQNVQLRCGCHNREYPTVKRLNGHLRSQPNTAVFLPSNTCASCCTTFSVSSFRRHLIGGRTCGLPDYARMHAVANSSERGVAKHRNYQAFRCALCGSATRLLETYLMHVDEHLRNDADKLECHCGKNFGSSSAEYRQHLLTSCVMKPCCDMCDMDFDTTAGFREHCATVHDNDQGEQFDGIQKDFSEMELPFTPLYACAECNLKCTQEAFLMKHLCLDHNYDQETAKRICADCFIGPAENNTTEEYSDMSFTTAPDLTIAATPDTIPSDAAIPENDTSETPTRVHAVDAVYETPKESIRRISNPMKYKEDAKHALFMQAVVKRLGEYSFECQICFKNFSYRNNFCRHLKLAHLRERSKDCYPCSLCTTNFTTSAEVQDHLLAEHLHSCNECDRKCSSLDELEKHRLSHLKISLTRDPNTHNYRRSNDGGPPTLTAFSEVHRIEEPKIDLKVLQNPCKLCKRLFVTPRGLLQHMRRTHANADLARDDFQPSQFPQKCSKPNCMELVRSPSDWVRHMRMHAETDDSDDGSKSSNDSDYFTCDKCFKVFANKCNLKQHLRTHRMSKNESGSSPPKTRYYCRICKTICPSHAAYMQHQQTHLAAKSKHWCKHCKVGFGEMEQLETHMQEEHGVFVMNNVIKKERSEEKSFQCPQCPRVTTTAHGLAVHMSWHRERKPMKRANAEDDGLPTLTPEDDTPGLLDTSKKVIRENTFVCIQCGDFFPNTTELRQHQAVVHRMIKLENSRPTKRHRRGYAYCKYCGDEFSDESELHAHMLEVHPTIIFVPKGSSVCSVCGLQLGSTAALSSHVRMHQRRGEYASNTPINNSSSSGLKQTKLVANNNVSVNGTHKYNCMICGLGFDVGTDLRRHICEEHPVDH